MKFKDEVLSSFVKEFKQDAFGEESDISDVKNVVKKSVELAYSDAKRTMHGINKEKRDDAINGIVEAIEEYLNSDEEVDFNELHNNLCKIWINELNVSNPELATYGRAQKIVNMSFKYLYSFLYQSDGKNLKKFENCHFVLDSSTIRWLLSTEVEGKPVCLTYATRWSKFNKTEYAEIQEYSRKAVSKVFPILTPLEAEFIIWKASKYYDLFRGIARLSGQSISNKAVGQIEEIIKNEWEDLSNMGCSKFIETLTSGAESRE